MTDKKIDYLGEGNVVQSFLDMVSEGVSTSIVKSTKLNKLDRLAGAKALSIAREKKDPLYLKYVKFNKKRKALKEKLIAKYGTRARKAAKDVLGKS